jgi:hypothetical protein
MSSVDDRIVNMQFNNKQFEAGAKQSRKTLAGLEGAVTKTGKGSGLTNMANGANAVSKRFSVMQVAGISAIATIASKATVAGLSLVKSLTIDPILQGWDEYNTNLKSIQTVMANTGKGIKPVQSALKQLNDYSDQTIYNFSEMARNVGTFSAAGVNLKTSVSAIKGIANIAALSGSSSQQASTAMYQLSQAIAAGRVNLQDWNSVVNAGMGGKNLQSALINTGIAMGKIDAKTVKWGKNIKIAGESFRTSISAKGGAEAWLGSDVLVQTLALMDGRLSSTALKAKLLAKNQKLAADQQLSTTEINKQAAEQLEKNQKAMEKQGFTPKQIESMTSMANRAYESATVVKTLPQLMGVVKESIGSVWANAFTGIVGNFEQSKKLWTSAANSISKRVQAFSMSLNQSIFMWKKGVDGIGGRTAVIRGFQAVFKSIGSIFKTVGQAFRDVFPPSSVSVMAKISVGFMRLAEALVPSEQTLKSLRSIFGGIFAVMHIGVSLVTGIAAGFKALFGAMFAGSGKAGGGILKVFASVGELLKGIDKMLTEGGKMTTFFETIGTVVGTALHPVVAIISSIVAAFGSLASGNPKEIFESIGSSLGGLTGKGDKIAGMFNAIGDSLGKLDAGKVKAFFASLDFSKAGEMARQGVQVATGIITGIVKGLASEGVPAIKAAMSAVASAVIDTIKGVLGINSPATTMVPIGKNIVDGIAQGIADGINALPGAIGEISGALKSAFSQLFGGFDSLDFAGLINAVIGGSLMVSFKKMADATTGVLDGVRKSVTDTFGAIQSELKAKALMEIGIAIGVLAGALLILSFIPMDKLAKGLVGMSIALGMIVYALKVMSGFGQTVDKDGEIINKFNFNLIALAGSMLLISVAMIALATAVAIFGNMDLKTLIKGLIGMAIAMAIMVKSMNAMSGISGKVASAGLAILLIATAMNVMAGAIAMMGNMDMMTLAKGLIAMSIGLSIMTSALVTTSSVGENLKSAAFAIVLMAGAMVIMATAVGMFGSMDWSTLAKGFLAVTFSIILFTGALMMLASGGPAVMAAGAAMVMMAGAMALLVPVIALLGQMDWGTLGKGLLGLAAAMAIFVIAVAALGAVAMVVGPGLIMLATALAIAGVGAMAFAQAFAIMAGMGAAGVATLIAAFMAIIALLPTLARQIAAALTSMIETFAKAAPRWRKAMGTIIKAMLGTIRDNVPALAKTLMVLITTGLRVLVSAIPKFVSAGFKIIIGFLKAVRSHIGEITTIAIDIVIKFMKAVGSKAGQLAQAGVNLIIKFINAVTKAIDKNATKIGTAAGKLGVAIVKGMVKGLWAVAGEIYSAALDLAKKAIDKIKDKFKIFSPSKVMEEIGVYVGRGLALGISGGGRHVEAASDELASAAIDTVEGALGIASPSKKAKWWGTQIGAGLAAGLSKANFPAVRAMLDLINSVIAAGDSTVLGKAQAQKLAVAAAAKEQQKAALAKKRADAVPKKNKKAKKAANAAATKAANKASAAAKAAANAQTALDNAIAYRDADDKGKADIQQAAAKANADKATKLMAKAAQESAQAKALARSNAKLANALRAQALKDAKAAKAAAETARKQQNKALELYATEIKDRIQAMKDVTAAEEKAKKDQEELDAASSPQAKADILNARAKALEDQAAARKADMEALIAKAEALANKDAVAAAKLLDQADQAAADAKAAADEAAQDRQAAEQALGTDASGGTGSVGDISPSESVLQDAASIVDRYSESLAEAQIAAQADQPVIQFVQNNTSPESLSVSEVYRQTNNLMSLATLKMGAKPPGTN